MEKKKIIFIAGSLNAGGAEKSLTSQLRLFDSSRFEIYLYVFNNSGLFKELVPSFVKYVDVDPVFKALGHSPSDLLFFVKHPIWWLKKIIRTSQAILLRNRYNAHQIIWSRWRNEIHPVEGKFDIAVGCLEGMPDYFVLEKVDAKRKIIWIHSEYEKLGYNQAFDSHYFSMADEIVTISEVCKLNLKKYFPEYSHFQVLHNISSSELISSMSNDPVEDNLFRSGVCNVVSVGRLVPVKNYHLAINAASLLKDDGFQFRWIIVGEGPEHKSLQKTIDKCGLHYDVLLIGQKANPYKYIKRADVCVQSSIYEGKSIFADEAKILKQIFVTTNYDTVRDVVIDGENGIIVEMTPESLSEGIKRAYSDEILRARIKDNLSNENLDNQNEIENYYKVYLGEDTNV